MDEGGKYWATPINQKHNELVQAGYLLVTDWMGTYTKYLPPEGQGDNLVFLVVAYDRYRKHQETKP